MSIFQSIKGFFGQTIHYKDGERIGETWDGLLPGTKNHYRADGSFAGSSSAGFLADEVHYNEHGGRIGESWHDESGTSRFYGDNGDVGVSYDGLTSRISVMDEGVDALFSSQDSDDSYLDTSDSYDYSDW
jgi:hypothetical protein